ncbi:MAG: MFS transporter, partial [Actinobacteria bacterium]|nr:MFS transporter [Actinomycetota bacterium]
SVLCGIATSMPELIAYRAFQGLGGGGLVPLGLAAIGDLFPPRVRGRYQGYISVTFATAAVLGPLAGGVLTDYLSWRWVFFMNVPLAVIALAAVVVTMRRPVERRAHSLDLTGAALLSAAVTVLLLALVWGGREHAWGSPTIVGLLAGGSILIALLVAVERRAPEPIVPAGLLRSRDLAVPVALGGLVGAALYAALIFVPVFGQGALGSSATRAGGLLVPLELIWSATSVTTGFLVYRTGRYRIFPTLGMAFLAGGFWLLTGVDAGTGYGRMVVNMLLLGVGMGLTMQILNLAAQNAVRQAQIGTATGIYYFTSQIGGMLSVAVFGTVLARRFESEVTGRLGERAETIDLEKVLRAPREVEKLASDLVPVVRESMAAALHWVFVGGFGVAVLAFLTVLLMREKPLRRTNEEVEPVSRPDPDAAAIR